MAAEGILVKPVGEQILKLRLHVTEGAHYVPDIPRRRHIDLIADDARRSAVIRHRNDCRNVHRVLSESSCQYAEAGAAADQGDFNLLHKVCSQPAHPCAPTSAYWQEDSDSTLWTFRQSFR